MDPNDEERIEIAEQVLLKIAKRMTDKGLESIRQLVQDHIFESMVEGQVFEFLQPERLLDSLKQIDIELELKEEVCMLEVLAKQNMIVMEDLEDIMQNVQEALDNGQDVSESASPQQNAGKGNDLEDSYPDPASQSKGKVEKPIDLGPLDQDSLLCMLELMMALIESEQTVEEFF